ncbi:MAG: hypothetical protein ACTSUX_03890 [Promethearchaeota archaeon]
MKKRWVKPPRFKYHYKRIAQYLKNMIKIKTGIRVVDIGCGTGRGSLHFSVHTII